MDELARGGRSALGERESQAALRVIVQVTDAMLEHS